MNKQTNRSNQGVLLRFIKATFMAGVVPALLLLFSIQPSQAGSATWNTTPTSGYWYYSANWTPATVPNMTADTATFGTSSITSLTYASYNVGTIVFDPGASAYTIYPSNPYQFTMAGAGVINNSGILQQFIVPNVPVGMGYEESENLFTFVNSATAGILTQYTVYGSSGGDCKTDDGGLIYFKNTTTAGSAAFIVNPGTGDIPLCSGLAGAVEFFDSSSAGDATFINNGGTLPEGGTSQAHTTFGNSSTAANATFTNYGGTKHDAFGGWVEFYDQSTAGNATITNNAGQVPRGLYGETSFYENATAANATLIANGGVGAGGRITFWSTASGGTARIEVFGDGQLDISGRAPGLITGSLEGNGLVFLGSNNLTLGSNALSTSFSGVIQDGGLRGGPGGSLTKTGNGRLILSGANTYTGTTTVQAGTLLVNNMSGSGTGTGSVFVTGGTFGGAGTIAGRVSLGTGNGAGAFLAPGKSGVSPGTLTIQKRLILEADATYKVTFDSRTPAADKVTSYGASIRNASISFNDVGASVIPSGTVFTVIDNTASIPIVGTFSNLTDGGTIQIGNNTFQANYEGGDGNDLTLTVVP